MTMHGTATPPGGDPDPVGTGAHYVELAPDRIRPNPRQPRQVFDEDALDVVDDAAHRRGVSVSRRQRCHAPAEAATQLVKFGKFCCARHQTSLG
jgi:hypothetical protein